jgi:hypothetical protein
MRKPVNVESVLELPSVVEWSFLKPYRLCRHPSIRTHFLSDVSLVASWASFVQQALLADKPLRGMWLLGAPHDLAKFRGSRFSGLGCIFSC